MHLPPGSAPMLINAQPSMLCPSTANLACGTTPYANIHQSPLPHIAGGPRPLSNDTLPFPRPATPALHTRVNQPPTSTVGSAPMLISTTPASPAGPPPMLISTNPLPIRWAPPLPYANIHQPATSPADPPPMLMTRLPQGIARADTVFVPAPGSTEARRQHERLRCCGGVGQPRANRAGGRHDVVVSLAVSPVRRAGCRL